MSYKVALRYHILSEIDGSQEPNPYFLQWCINTNNELEHHTTPHWPRQSSYFATLGARVDTRYFIVLHSTKTPVLYRTNTHMDKIIMGDSGPLAAQKSFSEYSVSSSPSVLISV